MYDIPGGGLIRTNEVPSKGYWKGLEFPEIRGTLFWGPYKKGPTI